MTKHFFRLSVITAAFCFMSCSESTIDHSTNNFPDSQDKLEKCAANPNMCPEGTTCNGTVCLINAEIGDSCSEVTSFCKGGKCVEGKCQSSGNGDTTLPCGDTTCTGNQKCVSDKCVEAAGAGEHCDASIPCTIDLKCNPKTKTCMTPIPLDGTCGMENSYCVIGTCSALQKCEASSADDTLKNTDSDGDTISDYYDRCDAFSNPASPSTPNCQSQDSDGDTIPDKVEALNGGDIYEEPFATFPPDYNFMQKDSDLNDIPDSEEACPGFIKGNDRQSLCGYDEATGFFNQPYDTDGDTIPDYASSDNDGDMASDYEEIIGLKTAGATMRDCDLNCHECDKQTEHCAPGTATDPWDTDGDTLPDYLSPDSDGDTIPDLIESKFDSDKDGIADRYSQDSDSDGIPDHDEVDSVIVSNNKYIIQIDQKGKDILINGNNLVKDKEGNYYVYNASKNEVTPISADQVNGQTFSKPSTIEDNYCFQHADCDRDGLKDKNEVTCDEFGWSGNTDDVDGDSHKDAAEYAVAMYAIKNEVELKNGKTTKSGSKFIKDPKEMMCDPNINVKDIFDYYFNLPVGGDEENDLLMFIPEVSKLDLVFNVDTTSSMDTAITTVKSNVNSIINNVRSMVTDSGFGLTTFNDFPVANCNYSTPTYPDCGRESDLPFRLLGVVSTQSTTVANYTKNSSFTASYGSDYPEAGAESLYQIATGEGVSWTKAVSNSAPKSIAKRKNVGDTWGGVDFRKNTLPVVIHITDDISHDKNDGTYFTNLPSNLAYPATVTNPHYSGQLIPMLKQKGIRVITMNVGDAKGEQFHQMTTWSRESNAVVPACAFTSGKCDLGTQTAPVTVNGRPNQCILKYEGEQNRVAEFAAQGVDALVKYGTYEVATVARTDPQTPSVDTSCFIKRVEAVKYYPPENEPEKSCNPIAVEDKISINNTKPTYANGFTNFAPGTSKVGVVGAKLEFKVIAQNLKHDGSGPCVPAANETQVFTAYIDVINPTTGLVFGTRPVSIIVPADTNAADN